MRLANDLLDRREKFQLLVCFLVVSIASSQAIPFMKPWGADLHNLHVYQKCAAGLSPYAIDGPTCGDLWGRPMIYPPLLFHSFRWMRSLSLETAMRVWTTFLCAAFAAVLYVWARKIARPPSEKNGYEVAIFCALLLLQYPVVFTLERGATDAGAVILLTAAAYAFVRFGPVSAGCAAGLAVAYKLYPLVALAVIVPALLLNELGEATATKRRLVWLRFGGAAALAFLLPNFVYLSEARTYFTTILPVFAAQHTDVAVFAHSVPTLVGEEYRGFALLLVAGLLAVWCWAARRAFARGDAALAFAGALAMSTYAQKTSWDYNLVTTYPLLVVLFLRARRTNRFALLAFGLFALVGDRRLFAGKGPEIFTPQLHVALQLAFLVMAALAVGRGDEGGASPALRVS